MTGEQPLRVFDNHSRCRHLLCKGLFINQGLPPGKEASGDGNLWCGKSQTIFGPDDQICDREGCTDSSRSCYEPL